MKKVFACLCACVLLLTAAGCSKEQNQAPGQPGGGDARPTMGTVTAVDGSQITVQMGGRGGMGGGQPASGDMGEMPERPDGEMPAMPDGQQPASGEMPELPDGEAPEMPDGQQPASGEMPQQPDGEFEQEDLTFDISGVSVQRQTDDGTESASAEEIAVGDLVQLEMNESGEVTQVTILPARTDAPAGTSESTAA